MRRLSLKNKRKTLETKSATPNSDLKEISDENGGSLESANINENAGRASKLRRSRNQAEYEEFSEGDSVDSDSAKTKLNESTAKVGREKRGRGSTTGMKTEENGDSLDSAAESNARGSKSRRSRNLNEVEVTEIPNKRKKRGSGGEISGREVESILAVRTVKNRRRYKVHWKGLPVEEDSWVNENKLSCPEILQDFLRKQKEKKNLPKPIKVDEESEEYEVERVIEVRFKKGGKREFLIRWKGFSANDDTWEPEENLNCPDLINKFLQKLEKAKNVTSRELRANPVTTQRLTLNIKSAQLRYSRRPQTQNRLRTCICLCGDSF